MSGDLITREWSVHVGGGTGFSDDGEWWWCGDRWLPAWSPDRRRRWNGTRWQRVTWWDQVPRWVRCWGAAWAVGLGVWLPVTYAMWRAGVSSDRVAMVGVVLGSASVLATLVFGFALGRRRRWREFGLAVLAGTAGMLSCYIAVMLAQPDPNNTNDQAAGAGVVILGLPTAFIIAAILGLGAVAGSVTTRRRRRTF